MSPMRIKLLIFIIILLSISIVLFEHLKHQLYPTITILQSSIATFVFVMIIIGAITVLTHITVRRLNSQISKKQIEKSKLENALHDSQERYRAIFESSPNAILLLDAETLETIDFNSKAHEMLGYSHFEFERMPMKDYELVPESEIRLRFDRILKRGSPESYESRLRKNTGEFIDAFVNIKILKIGSRRYFLMSWDDVTERKRIQARALEQFDFLSILIETIPAPVFYKDKNGRYCGCNKAFEDFIGMQKNEIIGKRVHDIATRELSEIYFMNDEALLKNPGRQVYESTVRTKNRGIREVIFSKATYNDIKGQVAGIVGVITDITEMKKADQLLQRGRDSLAAQNKLLLEWTSPEVLYRPDFDYIIDKITEKVSEILNIDRVGIWLYNKDHTVLRCADLFDRKTGLHSHDDELVVAQYPSYFNALWKERVIVCTNSLVDPRYCEFVESYMKPSGVISLMDVPVIVSGEVIGVICNEHRGEPRNWTLEEQNFSLSISNLFSLAMEISRHKRLEESLNIARDNFVNIIEKMPAPVLIVDERKRLKYLNRKAESVFGERAKDMLGFEFPYRIEPGETTYSQVPAANGSRVELGFDAVQTRWDGEPAYLILIREKA